MNTQHHKREIIGEVATRSSFREVYSDLEESTHVNLSLVKYIVIRQDGKGFSAFAYFSKGYGDDDRIRVCGGETFGEARRNLLEFLYPVSHPPKAS